MYHIDISKKNISEIFGISDVTISKTYRKIFPYHKIIMSNEVTDLILEKRNKLDRIEPTMIEEDLIITNKIINVAGVNNESTTKSTSTEELNDYEDDSESDYDSDDLDDLDDLDGTEDTDGTEDIDILTKNIKKNIKINYLK
jgi:hypothetical protein